MKRLCVIAVSLILSLLSFRASSQINTDRVLANGRNALYFDDYVLAIQYFNQVINAKPYMAEPYMYRAMAKFNLDDYQGAEEDATLCIERNPFLYFAYQCRGAARQNLKNFQGAIEDYGKVLQYNPEDKQTLFNIGVSYAQLKNYNEADSTFDKLLKYTPKDARIYMMKGTIYAEKGDTAKALNYYSQSISFDKFYAPVYTLRSYIYLQQKKNKPALADLNESIKLDNGNVSNYLNRALLYYQTNNYRGALSDYDSAIKLEPDNFIARFNRALLRGQVGDNNRAIEDFDFVIGEDPKNYIAIYNRAILYNETGKYRSAIYDISTVLKEYPNFLPGYIFRSELKRKLGDAKGADNDYWYAYDLNDRLQKEKKRGYVVTGRGVMTKTAYRNLMHKEKEKVSKTDVREKSDNDIEKFNQLVVADQSDLEKSKYKDEYRGRIQDKAVDVVFQPLFVATYYEKENKISAVSYFDQSVEKFNQRKLLDKPLLLTNNDAPLNESQAKFHFESMNKYDRLIANDSNDVNDYFALAMDCMVLQNLSLAEINFSKAIDKDPSFFLAYFNRAVVRYKQIDLQQASSGSVKNNGFNAGGGNTITGNSFSIPVYVKGTGQNSYKGSVSVYDLILSDLATVIKLNPDFAYAYFNRGDIYSRIGEYKQAIDDYTQAILKNKDFADAYYNRGLAYLSIGNTQSGIQDLSKAGELGIVTAYGIIKRMTKD